MSSVIDETNGTKEPLPFPSAGPSVDEEQGLVPEGTFILPQEFLNGLNESALDPFEQRLIKELQRREFWIMSLGVKLRNAYAEIKRLQALVPGKK